MQRHFWCKNPDWTCSEIFRQWPEEIEHAIVSAENVLKGRFIFKDHWELERTNQVVDFGPNAKDIPWDHVPADDVEWMYSFNRHTYFMNLGKAWLHTHDDRYARRYAELIEDWIDRVPLTEESKQTTWRSLEAGLRCEYWLRALQMFQGSSVLTDDLRKKIDDCLLIHGAYLVEQSGDFHKFSNWGVLQDHGLYLMGVWFDRRDWQDLAAQRLDSELHRQVMADGTHWEQSPMYHCEVLRCAMDAVLIARQNGLSLPRRLEENVRKMCRALLAMITPDGRLICQGDSDAIDARDVLALGALVFDDPQLRSASGAAVFSENLWDFGEEACRLAQMAAEPAPSSMALPDSGNFLLRSDCGSDAAYLHFHCGSVGGGHGHADLLHIDAGIGGESVLVDSGRYTYVNNPTRHALKSPRAHNTTTVDGLDFTKCRDTWSWERIAVSLKGEYRFSECVDFVSGHHLGYLKQGVAVGREILWLKEWKTAVIFDQFFADDETAHCYEQYFHLAQGQTRLKDNRLSWQGTHAQADLICLGDVDCRLEKAPYSTTYNQLLDGSMLTVSRRQSGFGWFVTVVDLAAKEPLSARLLPLSCGAGPLDDPRAKAVELCRGEKRAVVMHRSGDAVPPAALLRAGGYEGYGRAILFDNAHPDGLCLAW